MDDFCSNDYLGFSSSKEDQIDYTNLIKLSGSTGSRLITGNRKEHEASEKIIAKYFNSTSALLFNSGFDANLGLLSSIPQEEDAILLDSECHASLKIGAKLSKAKTYYYRHCDKEHLKNKLQRLQTITKGTVFVVSESIFSMTGRRVNLRELFQTCESYNAPLIIDEAHSVGIIGKNGTGLVTEEGLDKKVFCKVVTFGKAFGSSGAAILGSDILISYLINFAPSFIYSTAISINNVCSIIKSIRRISLENTELIKLNDNIYYFSKIMNIKMESPIFFLKVPDESKRVFLKNKFEENNILVHLIKSPTVRRRNEGFRIVIHSFNTIEQINRLAKIIKEVSQ